jgi:hypothetical protein
VRHFRQPEILLSKSNPTMKRLLAQQNVLTLLKQKDDVGNDSHSSSEYTSGAFPKMSPHTAFYYG